MRSLTLKLIISFVSVAALSIAVLAVVINRAASIEFTSYLELIGRMQGMMEGMMGGMMGYGRNMMGMMGALGEPEQKFLGNLRSSLVWTGIATIGLALVTAILLARQIVLPLRRLTAATRELAAGNLKQRVEVTSHDEIGEVGRAFNSMADKLARNEELRRNM
ncbi:MAG: HAMP domain-containing protein, partial [Chloroflexi bacterium]|nr:HAMP domain-containing protein [Chloroflexota bacterium]